MAIIVRRDEHAVARGGCCDRDSPHSQRPFCDLAATARQLWDMSHDNCLAVR